MARIEISNLSIQEKEKIKRKAEKMGVSMSFLGKMLFLHFQVVEKVIELDSDRLKKKIRETIISPTWVKEGYDSEEEWLQQK